MSQRLANKYPNLFKEVIWHWGPTRARFELLEDVAFYLDYARQCGSPILELACGTGRILIPLAEAGFEMYGLDLSENMLTVCRRKVEEKGLADWDGGDHCGGAAVVTESILT